MKITLAGKEFEVRPLTLRQIRDISVSTSGALQNDNDPSVNAARAWDRRIDVLVSALKRDNPEITKDSILDMETTHEEVFKAHDDLLRFSGLVPKEDAKPGEAVAEAA